MLEVACPPLTHSQRAAAMGAALGQQGVKAPVIRDQHHQHTSAFTPKCSRRLVVGCWRLQGGLRRCAQLGGTCSTLGTATAAAATAASTAAAQACLCLQAPLLGRGLPRACVLVLLQQLADLGGQGDVGRLARVANLDDARTNNVV